MSISRRASTMEEMKAKSVMESYMRMAQRKWKAGDVYAPKDLRPAEMKKWGTRRATKKPQDIVDVAGFNPVDNYRVRLNTVPLVTHTHSLSLSLSLKELRLYMQREELNCFSYWQLAVFCSLSPSPSPNIPSIPSVFILMRCRPTSRTLPSFQTSSPRWARSFTPGIPTYGRSTSARSPRWSGEPSEWASILAFTSTPTSSARAGTMPLLASSQQCHNTSLRRC